MCQVANWVRFCSCEGGEADRHGGGIEHRHHRAQEDVPDDPCIDADVLTDDSSNAPRALCAQACERPHRDRNEGLPKSDLLLLPSDPG